jgi:hypothetical protein
MGRGRAKAKQTKVARELKYRGSGTDLDALRAELLGPRHDGVAGSASGDEVDDVDDDGGDSGDPLGDESEDDAYDYDGGRYGAQRARR